MNTIAQQYKKWEKKLGTFIFLWQNAFYSDVLRRNSYWQKGFEIFSRAGTARFYQERCSQAEGAAMSRPLLNYNF